jgi:hypothetical protein
MIFFFHLAQGIALMCVIVFTAWILPRRMKTLMWGPTLYLVLNALIWMGVVGLDAWVRHAVDPGSVPRPGLLSFGIVCFLVGLFAQLTPKELYRRRGGDRPDDAESGSGDGSRS